jgi:hypothetical protein
MVWIHAMSRGNLTHSLTRTNSIYEERVLYSNNARQRVDGKKNVKLQKCTCICEPTSEWKEIIAPS